MGWGGKGGRSVSQRDRKLHGPDSRGGTYTKGKNGRGLFGEGREEVVGHMEGT